MSRLLKGVGVLTIEVAVIDAENPDCNTSVSVVWTDLGETYQVERKLNVGGTWGVIYTGSAFVFNDTVANSDGVYYYRVRVLSDDVWSNEDSVQVYEQNKFIRDVGCYPDFNVEPYYFRKMYRLNCGEDPVDTVDEPTCKGPCTLTGATVNFSYFCYSGDTNNVNCHSSEVYTVTVSGTVDGGKVGDTVNVGLSDYDIPCSGCWPSGCGFTRDITVGDYSFHVTGWCRVDMKLSITSFTITGCE